MDVLSCVLHRCFRLLFFTRLSSSPSPLTSSRGWSISTGTVRTAPCTGLLTTRCPSSTSATSRRAGSPWTSCTWATLLRSAGETWQARTCSDAVRLPSHADSALLRRYKDYREPPWSNTPYELSKEFWTVLAVRLSFVIVFQVRRHTALIHGTFLRRLRWTNAPGHVSCRTW